MAGEIHKTHGICLRIQPWSRTSHVVHWLTPMGSLTTIVKGAVRPKSAFLGQYDLNYTCEVLYYIRSRNGLHPLRECTPLNLREDLRTDYRKLILAGHFRELALQFAPTGQESEEWYSALDCALEALHTLSGTAALLGLLLTFELKVLKLAGLNPLLEAETGAFFLRGARQIPIPAAVAKCLRNPQKEQDLATLLSAARAIGIFYMFHLETRPETRRNVLKLIST